MQHTEASLKMMFVSVFLFVVLGTATAHNEDLPGKVFTFPQETNSAHVKITTTSLYLGAVTVCLRFFTDITRDHSLFSMSTLSHQNSFLIFKKQRTDEIMVIVRDTDTSFYGQDYKTNTWQSVCSTWDANTGLVQLWLNGQPSSRKFATNSNLSGPIIIVLGQEQDTHGGGFDINQSFVGMMTDVHMWDYVLTPDEIQHYSQRINFPNGNVVNWESLEFQITGRVLIEEEQKDIDGSPFGK